MALINISQPTSLLGRRVVGSYRTDRNGPVWPFDGHVECVVIPAPGFDDEHDVAFFVSGEFISIHDCISLDYAPPAVSA